MQPARTSAPRLSPQVSLKVLVVDDNADFAELLAMRLRHMGHRAAVATDGPSALTAAQRLRPDLVFLDIGLPGMSGYDLARELKREPALAPSRIVAVTGWGHEDDRRLSREAGFDMHLVKPLDAASIERALQRLSPGHDPSGARPSSCLS